MEQGSAYRQKEKEQTRIGSLITKVGENQFAKELSDFWDAMKNALRNPLSELEVQKFEERINDLVARKEEKRIFDALEHEMRMIESARSRLDIRKEEAEAVFAYASAGKPEEKAEALLDLQDDVRNAYSSLRVLDAKAEKLADGAFEKLTALAEKGDVKKDDIGRIAGNDPELAAALHFILRKQEATSIAARALLELDRSEFEKLFGISAKNEALAVLALYRKIMGDQRFAKARDSLARGEAGEALVEVRKMGVAAQYVFLALLAPALMRGGMWGKGVMGLLGKMLGKVKEAALRSGRNPESEQVRYMKGVRTLVSRFADFRAVNLALFSASFLSSLARGK